LKLATATIIVMLSSSADNSANIPLCHYFVHCGPCQGFRSAVSYYR